MSRLHVMTHLKGQNVLVCLLIFFVWSGSVPAMAQKRGGYLSLDAGVYVLPQFNPAIGLHLGGNALLANEVYLGAELGVVKFDHLSKPYLPLLARFSAMPSIGSGRSRLLILLAPGYGLYRDDFRRGNDWYYSKGGFSFYGGFGAVIPGKGRGSLSLSVGYTTFGFETNGHESNIDGVGIRIGAMIR